MGLDDYCRGLLIIANILVHIPKMAIVLDTSDVPQNCNITSACPSAQDLPTDLLTCWTEQFSTMIADIDCIIFTLS